MWQEPSNFDTFFGWPARLLTATLFYAAFRPLFCFDWTWPTGIPSESAQNNGTELRATQAGADRILLRPMRIRLSTALVSVLLSCVAVSQSPPSITPQIVVVPSCNLRLKGYLWRPAGKAPSPAVLFVHCSGSTDALHTSGFAITEASERLAPTFIKHGYAFLYLFRRGQGLSANQGPFMQDVLQREKETRGEEARKRLQFVLLTT